MPPMPPMPPVPPRAEGRHRHIPFQRAEIVDMLCADGRLSPAEQAQFRAFAKLLMSLYHFQLHEKIEALKRHYFPFNPDEAEDREQRRYPAEGAPAAAGAGPIASGVPGEAVRSRELRAHERALVDTLADVLNHANFERIERVELTRAMREHSLVPLRMSVDFDDFDSHFLFWRGQRVRRASVPRWWFWRREIDVPTFDRVVILVKFKEAAYFRERKRRAILFEPGSLIIKLFKNIPKADLEMLFPNTEIRMRLGDKLLLGVPGIAGGAGVVAKSGAALAGAAGIVWLLVKSLFEGGEPRYPGPKEMAAIVGALVATGALAAYLWRQWNAYKNRKILFLKTLGDNLYFRNIDNNAGVFHHVIDAAEEEETKEALLAYYFLLVGGGSGGGGGLDGAALDRAVEAWFGEKHGVKIDFEVDDAVKKLRALGLCRESEGATPRYVVLGIGDGCRRLDEVWDGLFEYNA